jgi:hypothetical protein
MSAVPVDTIVAADGTLFDASLEPAGSVPSPFLAAAAGEVAAVGTVFGQPVDASGAAVPADAVPTVAEVNEEVEQARVLTGQLIRAVRDYSANRPRSLQTRIGPSEIGTPCLRQLAYKVAGQPAVNSGGGDPWPSFVGTATHASLEQVFGALQGWAVEQRIVVDPDVLGYPLAGNADLIRLLGGIVVVDHKVVGADTMRKAKANGPAGYYRTQAHSYAHGLIAAGVPVEYVAIAYWPRSGRLSGLHVWLERYRQDVVDLALTKLDAVRQLHSLLGSDLFAHLPVAEHYCDSCPFYRSGSGDPSVACAGADAIGRGLAP